MEIARQALLRLWNVPLENRQYLSLSPEKEKEYPNDKSYLCYLFIVSNIFEIDL